MASAECFWEVSFLGLSAPDLFPMASHEVLQPPHPPHDGWVGGWVLGWLYAQQAIGTRFNPQPCKKKNILD